MTTTPGPWTVATDTDIYAPGPDGKLLVAECDSSNFIPYAQKAANARLIAAAPALLAALQEIAERGPVGGYGSPSALRLRLVATQSMARAAIALTQKEEA